ncbi:hypothetical protein GGQ96_002305 [Sphingomonas abaci]|uniref:Ice-binding protein C-terminal domain-containing protein n=1 Tax=Sphingomonas abaci TaxID=237611 RepID=A0A7W7EYK8_9SPHN|nr:PEPxxWA-CTERM sorting domain-containing protein [Sphingomonas abaci]MBB4618169.1 hypothetical protein [Sphingomonas abaci]
MLRSSLRIDAALGSVRGRLGTWDVRAVKTVIMAWLALLGLCVAITAPAATLSTAPVRAGQSPVFATDPASGEPPGSRDVIRIVVDGRVAVEGVTERDAFAYALMHDDLAVANAAHPPRKTGIAAAIAAVPEPAGWALMILGFGLLGLVLRRQVRRSNARFDRAIKQAYADIER